MQRFRAAVCGGVRSQLAVDSSRRSAPLFRCWRYACVCQLEQLLRPVQHINTAAARSGRGSAASSWWRIMCHAVNGCSIVGTAKLA